MLMNETKFTGRGSVYASSRPTYPFALFDALSERGVFRPYFNAADIGAGTGIFTNALSGYVEKVYAVEPNADMLNAAQNDSKKGNIVFLSGNAEHTGLPDGSVDVITAAQAFHWFDAEAFAEECKRIFRPDADRFVVLAWNDRDPNSEVIKANFEVNRRFCPSFNGSSDGADLDGIVSRFFDGKFDLLTFDNGFLYDEKIFLSRSLSSSYAPRPENELFEPYVAALREVFRRNSIDGKVLYRYITRCYIGNL